MMTLSFAFWMYVFIFAVIGTMRGWAKELLVTFSVILALFIIAVIERFVPTNIREFFLTPNQGVSQFWIRACIVIILIFFGYQTPNLPRVPAARFAREKLSDALLGFVMGALNGYLIVGTLWYFMDQSSYPFAPNITRPAPGLSLLNYLPPKLLIQPGSPYIYFAIAVAFLFVLVVFI
jgi:hypothetical protein